MRFIVIVFAAITLAACSQTWETRPPVSPAGGTGITHTGSIVAGPEATSSVASDPKYDANGRALPPYGANATAAAYEFGAGYRVGAGDRLAIRVVGQPDLTGDYIVSGAGEISFPLIGTVKVAGITSPQIRGLITARLKNGYLRAPAVSVQVTNLRPFFILGEVNRAGSFPYQNGMTIQNAVAIAGGYSPRANQGAVMLTRKSAGGTRTYKAPVTTQIYPGDIIFVRERWF